MLTNRRGMWKELVGLQPGAKTGMRHFLKQKNLGLLLKIRLTFDSFSRFSLFRARGN